MAQGECGKNIKNVCIAERKLYERDVRRGIGSICDMCLIERLNLNMLLEHVCVCVCVCVVCVCACVCCMAHCVLAVFKFLLGQAMERRNMTSKAGVA